MHQCKHRWGVINDVIRCIDCGMFCDIGLSEKEFREAIELGKQSHIAHAGNAFTFIYTSPDFTTAPPFNFPGKNNCRCTLHPAVKKVVGRTPVGEGTIVDDDPAGTIPLLEEPD